MCLARKANKLMRQVDQVTNILTGGKVQYNNITKQALCSSPTFVARFHPAALKYMIKKGDVDETYTESAMAMLPQLQQQKQQTEIAASENSSALWMHIFNQKPESSSTTTAEVIAV